MSMTSDRKSVAAHASVLEDVSRLSRYKYHDKIGMPTTARRIRNKHPQSPLQSELVKLVNAARLERRVGYMKLSHITGYGREQLQRTLTRGFRTITIEGLLCILDALGYNIEIRVTERELTNEEHEYFTAYGAGTAKYRPTVPARASQEPVFTVRLCPAPPRTRSGSEAS